jgi:hypothetical protein
MRQLRGKRSSGGFHRITATKPSVTASVEQHGECFERDHEGITMSATADSGAIAPILLCRRRGSMMARAGVKTAVGCKRKMRMSGRGIGGGEEAA